MLTRSTRVVAGRGTQEAEIELRTNHSTGKPAARHRDTDQIEEDYSLLPMFSFTKQKEVKFLFGCNIMKISVFGTNAYFEQLTLLRTLSLEEEAR